MVTQTAIPVTESNYSEVSSYTTHRTETAGKRDTEIARSTKKSRQPATEGSEAYGELLPSTWVPSLTGAQVSTGEDAARTDSFVVFRGAHGAGLAPSSGRSALADLPRPARIVTTFEPHLRQTTVAKLQSLVEDFRNALDSPAAAAAKAELKAALTETYRRSALEPETRNFATAVSLLLDFLQPHWSDISALKLDGISEKLLWLGSQADVRPRILGKFYSELAAVVGGRISITVETDDDTVDDADVEDSGTDDASA